MSPSLPLSLSACGSPSLGASGHEEVSFFPSRVVLRVHTESRIADVSLRICTYAVSKLERIQLTAMGVSAVGRHPPSHSTNASFRRLRGTSQQAVSCSGPGTPSSKSALLSSRNDGFPWQQREPEALPGCPDTIASSRFRVFPLRPASRAMGPDRFLEEVMCVCVCVCV